MGDNVQLSRRQREIMDIIYTRGRATATEVMEGISDRPSRDSVRTLLRILEEKGHLVHRKQGREFVYEPARSVQQAARSALDRVLSTFFGGSIEQAVAAHLSRRGSNMSDGELKRLAGLIRQAREKGR